MNHWLRLRLTPENQRKVIEGLAVLNVILLFSMAGAGYGFVELIQANRDRIHDIQQSRVYSCRQTYSKMQQILRLSARGRQLAPERRTRLNTLILAADPAQCAAEVKPRKKGT